MNKLLKIIVGLALESDIYNGRLSQELFDIYSKPNLDDVKALHGQLIVSDHHSDREMAIWLGLALKQKPMKIYLRDLISEMTEMEVLLSDSLWRVDGESRRDYNDWLNYIINASQSIQDGYFIDAKIMMSLAVQICRKPSIKKVENPDLQYKIGLLDRETFRIYEVIRRIPINLVIPEERLDAIMWLQKILIDLLRANSSGRLKNCKDLVRYTIRRLETSKRYLMRSDIQTEKAKKEIDLAAKRLELQKNKLKDKTILEWMDNVHKRIKALAEKIVS